MRNIACRGLAALALWALGCAAETGPSPAALAGERAHQIVVLPLNVVVTLPAELEDVVDHSMRAMERYLLAHGRKLKTMDLPTSRKLWRESIAIATEAGSEAGFPDALRELALQIGRHADFDVVAIGSLVVRPAHMAVRAASWDGAKQSVEIENETRKSGSIHVASSLRGGIEAASLHLVIVSREGEIVHEKTAGLALTQRIIVDGNLAQDGTWSFQSTMAGLIDPDTLRAGMERAFEPFLPALPPEAR